LLSALSDTDHRVRWAAVQALRKHKSAAARIPYLELLSDSDWSVRWTAAQALGDAKVVSAVGPLCKMLTDREPTLRLAAAEALGKIGSPDALRPLLRSFPDPSTHVREGVLLAIFQIVDGASVAEILPMLDQPIEQAIQVRKRIVDRLRELARTDPTPELRRVIPGLKRVRDGIRTDAREEINAALSEIEAATAAIKHLPVPVRSGVDSEHLPIAAESSEGACETPSEAPTVWWLRWWRKRS
jgi:HEAT repeat protein